MQADRIARERVLDPVDGRVWIVGDPEGEGDSMSLVLVDPIVGDWMTINPDVLATWKRVLENGAVA